MGGPDLEYTTGLESRRRSIYFQHAREKQMTFLKLFDAASPVECYRRRDSVVPQQALALSNSSLALAQARVVARAISREVGAAADAETNSAFVAAAFERVLCRQPTPSEREECLRFLEEQSQRLENTGALTPVSAASVDGKPSGDASANDPSPPGRGTQGEGPADDAPATVPAQRARENLVHVLVNHSDFVTIH
jgi:hypothetical protein